MKRILPLVLCVAMACGPSDKEPAGAKSPGAQQARALDVPTNTVMLTEAGADGYVAGRSTGMSNVTPDGSSSYALPLRLPEGRAG